MYCNVDYNHVIGLEKQYISVCVYIYFVFVKVPGLSYIINNVSGQRVNVFSLSFFYLSKEKRRLHLKLHFFFLNFSFFPFLKVWIVRTGFLLVFVVQLIHIVALYLYVMMHSIFSYSILLQLLMNETSVIIFC